MKTDNYLTLSLEQAAKSPLHYRHGCVIVRGGKVIGQGYNAYRSGFDGGALKHGRVANSVLSGPAMQEMKDKLKKRKEEKEKEKPHQPQSQQQTFHAFETTAGGAGHRANEPLTMHSEVMAIHSALSTSSKLASSAFSREKPCFKLPRADKRKARLRDAALSQFKSAVLKVPHLDSVKGEYNNNKDEGGYKERENGFHLKELEDALGLEEKGRAFQASLGGEKQRKLKGKKEKQQQKLGGQYQYHQGYQYEARDHHEGSRQQQRSVSKPKRNDVGDLRSNDNDHELSARHVGDAGSDHAKGMRSEKDFKRSGKMRSDEQPTQHTLVPTGRTSKSRSDVKERKKHPRLNGADLYVTRLGRHQRYQPREPQRPVLQTVTVPSTPPEEDIPPLSRVPSLSSSTSSLPSTTTTASLHDELTHPTPISSSSPTPSPTPSIDLRNCIRASRPCYRCIAYMHAVGIKRVFWTNDAGDWEGGKVAKLMAALEGDGRNGDGGVEEGMFVTKHEVLMLRRRMWEEGKG